MSKIVVIGAGGHSKVVLDVLQLCGYEVVGLTDAVLAPNSKVLEYPVLGDDSVLEQLLLQDIKYAAIGMGHVGNNGVRNRVYQTAKTLGLIFPIIVHPSAIVSQHTKIGDATLLGAGCVVNPDVQIGEACIINTSAVVEHEVVIGNGVHIAPNATVLGNVKIGDNSFVGAGVTIKQGVSIGKDCIVGAGSVVLSNIADNSVVVGCPARLIKRR